MSRALQRKLTVTELAQLWGWPASRILRLVHLDDPAQRLPALKIGRCYFFNQADLDAWEAAQRVRASAATVSEADYDAAFARHYGLTEVP